MGLPFRNGGEDPFVHGRPFSKVTGRGSVVKGGCGAQAVSPIFAEPRPRGADRLENLCIGWSYRRFFGRFSGIIVDFRPTAAGTTTHARGQPQYRQPPCPTVATADLGARRQSVSPVKVIVEPRTDRLYCEPMRIHLFVPWCLSSSFEQHLQGGEERYG